VLRVPSAVVPLAFNFLLNPLNSDFAHIVVGPPQPFTFDPRLPRPLEKAPIGVFLKESSFRCMAQAHTSCKQVSRTVAQFFKL
jgi:hypothetical protein